VPASFSRFPSFSRRIRISSRPAWLAARATNVLRRRSRLAGGAVLAFILILAAYIALPAGAVGVRTILMPSTVERPDTAAIAIRLRVAQRDLQRADSTLAFHRALAADEPLDIEPLPPSGARDSLSRSIEELATLLQRASNAPLPASYRALGSSPALRDNPRVAALLDSIADVQRERDALGSGGTVDPLYISLTTRLNALGRAIQGAGHERLAALRADLAALPAADSVFVAAAVPDSIAAANARAAALGRIASAEAEMRAARSANAVADSLLAQERSRTSLAAIPVLIAAAAVLATFISFAAAFMDEMRSPRVADAVEAERLTNQRVLTTIGLRSIPPDRARRAADRSMPSLLDPTADGYRILAWHIMSRWPSDGVVTVAGDEPEVAAVVGSNLAAVFAADARATLLVDAEVETGPVQQVLELGQSPGLAAVLENRRKWSEALVQVNVGRSRTIDVLPAGDRGRPLGPAESQMLIADVLRAARRHDATVVVSTSGDALRRRAGDDVVLCATAGVTRLATLARAVATLVDVGARVRGVVLWEGKPPSVRLNGANGA
jgi:Mrp family chromosome partitioning ATPase